MRIGGCVRVLFRHPGSDRQGRLCHGMDVYSYMAANRMAQCFGVGFVLYLMGKQLWSGVKNYAPVAAISVIFLLFSWLHYSSIEYLDIASVTMLVFLYPLILAALHFYFDKTKLTRVFLLSLATALVGLALVINPDRMIHSDFNIAGGAMAFGASILIASYLYLSNKVIADRDAYVFTVQLSLIPTLAFAGLSLSHGIALPAADDASGWALIATSLILSLVGQISFFVAIKSISALRVSLVMKLEPVVSILGAVWLLSESLTLMQYIGVFMVVSAIFAISQPVTHKEHSTS